MKYDCQIIKLKDCCSFQEGYVNPSQSHPEYFGGKIKWIRAVDLNNSNVYNTTRTLSEIGFNSAGKSALLFEPNTIVISKSGTIGRLGIIKDYMCGNRATINIKPKDNIDLTFLFYFLRSNQKRFEDLAVGSVQKNLYISLLENIEILLPTLPLQKKIVSIVKDIDGKIELNNAINNNLEQQAKALYKDWFFDFTPFSTDGNLPDGWRLGTVSDIIQLHDSKRVPLSGAERDKMAKIYPYYGATSVMDYVDNYLFDGIYLLLGEDGTVVDSLGFPILQYVYGQFWVNNHAHIITGKEGFSVEELYLFFSLTNIKSIVTGAVQQKVSQQNLKKVPANNVSGLCLNDDQYPIIIINNSMSFARQNFTLFHELYHLISNTSGAEIIRDDFYEYLNDQQTQSEKQCDVFANAFLVPIDDFKVELEKAPIDEDRITDLAILYSVSKEAIMYKLLTMKKITHKDYDRLKETFYGDALRNIPKKGKDGSGGNYYLTKLSYLGQRYAGDVFREYFSGRIDNVRASEMLNSKIDHLPKLESAYFRGLK